MVIVSSPPLWMKRSLPALPPLTATATDANNVTLTTAEGTIIVRNGTDQSITTVLNDTESTSMFFSSAPTGASVSGDNLVVTTDKGDFTVGGASDTVTMYAGDKTYTAESDRLTDITDANAKSVTLTSGFEKNYYGMHYSYSDGVTTVDATDANTTGLTLTGFKSEVALNLKGADKAANVITGGKGNDTLMGGTGNNSLKGNAGADLFIQNGKTDVILDYAEEDTIQLTEEAAKDTSGNDVTFTNGTGVLTVLNGSGLTINTTVVSDANTATSDDELWGVNGVKDTFLFDGGNDTIHGYEEQDAINLGGFSLSDLVSDAPTVKDNNVIFTFDKKNSFTVTDAVDKTISFTDGFSYSRDKK